MGVISLDLSDPATFLVTLLVVSFVAAISPAINVRGDWRKSVSLWLRDGSFGVGVPLVIYHRIENIGGDAYLLLGLAVLCASGGEQARRYIIDILRRRSARKTGHENRPE